MAVKGAIATERMTDVQLYATLFRSLANLDPSYPLPVRDRKASHAIAWKCARELRTRGVQLRLMD